MKRKPVKASTADFVKVCMEAVGSAIDRAFAAHSWGQFSRESPAVDVHPKAKPTKKV